MGSIENEIDNFMDDIEALFKKKMRRLKRDIKDKDILLSS